MAHSKKTYLGSFTRLGGERFLFWYDEEVVTAIEVSPCPTEIVLNLEQEGEVGEHDLRSFVRERLEWRKLGVVFGWNSEYECEQFLLINTPLFSDDDIDTDIKNMLESGLGDLLHNTDISTLLTTPNGNSWSMWDVMCVLS